MGNIQTDGDTTSPTKQNQTRMPEQIGNKTEKHTERRNRKTGISSYKRNPRRRKDRTIRYQKSNESDKESEASSIRHETHQDAK